MANKIVSKETDLDLAKYPVCVDLDGTLWAGDCLWVCIRKFLQHDDIGINICRVVQMFLWWCRGRTHLKHNLLRYVKFDAGELTYFQEILQYLTNLKNRGAKLYLVTGSDQDIAVNVLQHLRIFEEAFGSTIGNNLVGHKKAALLNQLFGVKQYVYFGNEWKDRFVWQHCVAAGCVNINSKTLKWFTSQKIYIRRFVCK